MKKFTPTQKQVELIKNSIANDMTYQEIASLLGINRNTLSRVVKDLGFDKGRKKVSGRKIRLSEDQIKILRSMFREKKKYSEIAKELGVNRNIITRLLEEYGIKTKRKTDIFHKLEREEVDLILEMSSKGVPLYIIARTMSIDTSSVSTILSEHNTWTKNKNVSEKDISAFLRRRESIAIKSFLGTPIKSMDDVKNIEKMMDSIPLERISEETEVPYDVLKDVVLKFNLSDKLTYNNLKKKPYFDDFYRDLSNPELSNFTVARRYGVSGQTVSSWRDREFEDFKTRINVWLNKSSAEIKFEEILIEEDLAYIYQKVINGYRVDYYLGSKLVVEVNGDYWHKEEINQGADKKKKKSLVSSGYEVLYVWESELSNLQEVKRKINNAFDKAISKRKDKRE